MSRCYILKTITDPYRTESKLFCGVKTEPRFSPYINRWIYIAKLSNSVEEFHYKDHTIQYIETLLIHSATNVFKYPKRWNLLPSD